MFLIGCGGAWRNAVASTIQDVPLLFVTGKIWLRAPSPMLNNRIPRLQNTNFSKQMVQSRTGGAFGRIVCDDLKTPDATRVDELKQPVFPTRTHTAHKVTTFKRGRVAWKFSPFTRAHNMNGCFIYGRAHSNAVEGVSTLSTAASSLSPLSLALWIRLSRIQMGQHGRHSRNKAPKTDKNDAMHAQNKQQRLPGSARYYCRRRDSSLPDGRTLLSGQRPFFTDMKYEAL